MQIKRILPGLLLGLLFIGVFMLGVNGVNPGNTQGQTKPALPAATSTTGTEVPALTAPDLTETTAPGDQQPVAVVETPLPDNSQAAAAETAPAAQAPLEESPVVDNQTVQMEPGEKRGSGEKGSYSKEEKEESDDHD